MPYLQRLEGESGQRGKRRGGPNESRDKDSLSAKYQRPSGGRISREMSGQLLSLRWETILEGG